MFEAILAIGKFSVLTISATILEVCPSFRDEFNNIIVPSTANPIGMKGCGEAGTIGSMAAVSNAMMDALSRRDVKTADMPFTPQRVWKMLQTEIF